MLFVLKPQSFNFSLFTTEHNVNDSKNRLEWISKFYFRIKVLSIITIQKTKMLKKLPIAHSLITAKLNQIRWQLTKSAICIPNISNIRLPFPPTKTFNIFFFSDNVALLHNRLDEFLYCVYCGSFGVTKAGWYFANLRQLENHWRWGRVLEFTFSG